MSFFPPELGPFEGVIRNMVNNGLESMISFNASNSFNQDFPPKNSIDFDLNTYFLSEDSLDGGQWISYELKDRYVALTHYIIKSTSNGYMRSWELSTSVNGNDWTVVHSLEESDVLSSDKGKIFRTKKIVARFFKIKNNAKTFGEYSTRFRISAFDLYGTIIPCFSACSNVPTFISAPKICQTKNSLHFHIFRYCFYHIFCVK